MRKIFYYLVVIAFIACEKPLPILEQTPPNTVLTQISLAGEITISKNNPTNDLVAIQILLKSPTNFNIFAHGLFDLNAIPAIELLDNNIYKIEATLIKDAKSKVSKDNLGNFRAPFLASALPTPITNSFNITTPKSFTQLFRGDLALVENSAYKTYARPFIERYTASSDQYSPAEGKSIELSAKRVFFAVELKCTGATNGEFEIQFENAPTIIIPASATPAIHTYNICLKGDPAGSRIILDDNYSENIPCTVLYRDPIGNVSYLTPLSGTIINFKRSTTTPITINLNKSNNSSLLVLESTPMVIQPEIKI